jgi:hypothetical protein
MGILEDIKCDFEEQLKAQREPFERVQDIKDLQCRDQDDRPDFVAVRMCLLQKTQFKKEYTGGWSLLLADKALVGAFETVCPQILAMDFERQSKYVFRLTVWERTKKAQMESKLHSAEEGSEIRADHVTGLNLFKERQAQGNTNRVTAHSVDLKRQHHDALGLEPKQVDVAITRESQTITPQEVQLDKPADVKNSTKMTSKAGKKFQGNAEGKRATTKASAKKMQQLDQSHGEDEEKTDVTALESERPSKDEEERSCKKAKKNQ